jgi:hypothetical protein
VIIIGNFLVIGNLLLRTTCARFSYLAFLSSHLTPSSPGHDSPPTVSFSQPHPLNNKQSPTNPHTHHTHVTNPPRSLRSFFSFNFTNSLMHQSTPITPRCSHHFSASCLPIPQFMVSPLPFFISVQLVSQPHPSDYRIMPLVNMLVILGQSNLYAPCACASTPYALPARTNADA